MQSMFGLRHAEFHSAWLSGLEAPVPVSRPVPVPVPVSQGAMGTSCFPYAATCGEPRERDIPWETASAEPVS